MSNITVFKFDLQEVRVILIDNEPWWVAKDVLKAMGTTLSVTRLETLITEELGKEFTSSQPLETPGGLQNVLVISEVGLTFYVSRSRTNLGKKFNRWLHREVLPSIRKTGKYSLEEETITELHQKPERTLPEYSAIDYANAATQVESLKDGLLKQLIKDSLIDELSLNQNLKYLPVAEKPKQYTIVKVRAKMLGYTPKQIGNGSSLGRFVKSKIEPSWQEMIGKYPVYHYQITQQLDDAIHTYFTH